MPTQSPAATEWWLQENGHAQGPYTHTYVTLRLQSGQLSPSVLACPLGQSVWRPLSQWSTFASLAQQRSGPAEPPPPPVSVILPPPLSRQHPSRELSDLPEMARWICIYGLFISPTLWLAGNLSCLSNTWTFVEESPFFGFEVLVYVASSMVGLVVTLLLFLGALRARQRESFGVNLLLTGLWLDMGLFVVTLGTMYLIFVAAASDTQYQHFNTSEPSAGAVAFNLLSLAFFASSGVFEIASLVWLMKNSEKILSREHSI